MPITTAAARSERGPMSRFDIEVTRDGGWWMVHIPELGGRTQARFPREVELVARQYIAVSTGTPIDQVATLHAVIWGDWLADASCSSSAKHVGSTPMRDVMSLLLRCVRQPHVRRQREPAS